MEVRRLPGHSRRLRAINLDADNEVVDIPVMRNGSPVEGATANEITFYT